MSTATYRSHQQTSRELDELEALVQRMLSAPFSADEPEKHETPPSASMSLEPFAPLPPTICPPPASSAVDKSVRYAWHAEMPAPIAPPLEEPPMALLVDTEEPVGFAEPRFFVPPAFPVAPAYSPPVLPAPVPYPYSVVFGQPVTSPKQPASVTAPSSPTTTIPSPQWQAPKQPVREPLPFLLWPVYLLNKIFDLLSYFLGPLGTWLRHSSGRNVLGWLGISMVLGAIGWGAADWYGLDWIK